MRALLRARADRAWSRLTAVAEAPLVVPLLLAVAACLLDWRALLNRRALAALALAAAAAAVARRAAPRVIVVEGEIGAGKSTLRQKLLDAIRGGGLAASGVDEPIDRWLREGVFQWFSASPLDRAYAFQTYTFVTRIIECIASVARRRTQYIVAERSVLTDRYVFMEVQRRTLPPLLSQMYVAWCGLFSRLMPFDLQTASFVYLKPQLDECMERVQQRHREGEIAASDGGDAAGVKREYQAELRMAHEAFLQGKHQVLFPGIPANVINRDNVVVVEGGMASRDFREPEHAREVCNFILAGLARRWPELALVKA